MPIFFDVARVAQTWKSANAAPPAQIAMFLTSSCPSPPQADGESQNAEYNGTAIDTSTTDSACALFHRTGCTTISPCRIAALAALKTAITFTLQHPPTDCDKPPRSAPIRQQHQGPSKPRGATRTRSAQSQLDDLLRSAHKSRTRSDRETKSALWGSDRLS